MPSLSSITAPDPRPADVPFGGEVIHVTYDARRMTPAFLSRHSKAETAAAKKVGAAQASVDAIVALLADILLGWDVTDFDGGHDPVPITAETLATLPFELLIAFRDALRTEARPPAKRSGSFGSG